MIRMPDLSQRLGMSSGAAQKRLDRMLSPDGQIEASRTKGKGRGGLGGQTYPIMYTEDKSMTVDRI